MCGIAGFIVPGPAGRGTDALHADALRMARALDHRGPDAHGAFADAEAGVALGHTRLGVQDPGPAGAQPMRSACGRYAIVYNGEVYDFRELRGELRARGHRFRGGSDTEVLLAAIAAFGLEDALRRLHGMFAFALWDREARALTLARDPIGKKPLYYAAQRRGFYFASELSALLAHPRFEARVDRESLGRFVRESHVPGPGTILRGVRKLPPGTTVVVRSGDWISAPAPRRYWSMQAARRRGRSEPFEGGKTEAVDALDALLRDAVRRRMVSDVPVGALLSGGVDSSSVVALMQAESPRRVRTYTIGFDAPDLDESAAARAVARHLGTEHTELVLSAATAREIVPDLPRIYSEPFGDTSAIPTALVARLAREDVTVALSGDGGDEVFAGYARHRATCARWRRLRCLPPAARAELGTGVATLGSGLRRALSGAGPAPLRQVAVGAEREGWLAGAPGPVELFARSGARCADPRAYVLGLGSPAPEPGAAADAREPLDAILAHDLSVRLPDGVLVKVDRASMAAGLEVRSPLLDTRVVEFAWRLPWRWKLAAGEGKWILRRVLERRLPRGLTRGPKRGFGAPVGAWLRGPLRDWAEDLLTEDRLRSQGWLDARNVRTAWREHLQGFPRRDRLLWNVLVFQAWLDAWGDRLR